MKKYQVDVCFGGSCVVEAEDGEEALDIAYNAAVEDFIMHKESPLFADWGKRNISFGNEEPQEIEEEVANESNKPPSV